MIQGILKILALTLVLLAFQLANEHFSLGVPIDTSFYSILAFFCLQSVGIHAFYQAGQKTLELGVPMLVMATMGIRVITALMALVIFSLVGIDDLVNFVITFFGVYLFYFVFEIITVLSNLRSNLK